MTREEIIKGIIEAMENCHADCPCYECPIKKYCYEWDKLLYLGKRG